MSGDKETQRHAGDDKSTDSVARASTPKPFSTVGATEEDEANRNQEVAPGFTDTEPGAGPDYGPSGKPGPDASEDPNQRTGNGFTAPEVMGEAEKNSEPGK